MRHRVLTIIASCCAWTLGAQPAQRASAPAAREFAVDFGASIVEFSIPFAFSRVK